MSVLLLSGCAGASKNQPETPEPRALTASDIQLLAGELVPRDQNGWEESREPLKTVMWNRGLSAHLRLLALDALLTHDEDDTVSMLWYLLPSETDWVVLEAIALEAQVRDWTRLAPSFVRSLRREVVEPSFTDRPEHRALVALHPDKTIEEIIYGVFADTSLTSDLGTRARQDAWTLLLRLDPQRERVLDLLASSGSTDDPLMGDLQAAASDLHAIATTPEQMRWLEQMRQPEHASFWSSASTAIGALRDGQREDLTLAHVGLVTHASAVAPEIMSETRQSLLSMLHARFDGRSVVERGTGDTFDHPELLETWEDDLSWGDLLSLVMIDDILNDPALLETFFAQAQEDRFDNTTEHGGIIDPDGQTTRLRRFIPRPSQRRGDTTYIAPPEMMVASTRALAMYHFHANGVQNRDRAGPSSADLRFARESGRVCVVLTLIRRERLDVDVYFPSGAIVDLGVFESPR